MRAKAKKLIRLFLGWGFILLGVIGLFLPILQGVLFLIVGLVILSSEYAWAHDLLQKIRIRFPKASSRLDEATAKAHQWMDKLFHRKQRSAPDGTTKAWSKPD
ncbi:MAG TPA: PGPGW domain-containing protein [Terriglobales bacterium]|nr:PGPGW domain-containing protein [Terriglobales bacterium]